MKRYLAVVTMLLVLVLSCTVGSAKELVWSGWSGEEAATKPMIEKMLATWNAEHPDAQFAWVGWPWGNTLEQLIIRSQGGEALDVAQIDIRWLTALAEADVLVDLSTVMDKAWLEGNFEESYLVAGQIDGKQLGLPWTLASIGMVFNPSLLEQAGVEEVPATIAEFEAALEALKNLDPGIIPYAATTKDPGSMSADFQAWLWTFGAGVFDDNGNVVINSDSAVECLTWFKSLLDRGYIRMDVSRFDARELYAQNVVGFYDDAVMCNGILKTNTGLDNVDAYIEPMLRPVLTDGDAPQSKLWGHMLVMLKSTTDSQNAAAFLQHVVGEELALDYFVQAGMLPVVQAAVNNPIVQDDIWANKWLQITVYGRMGETEGHAKAAQLDTIITEEVQAALMGSKTPKKALDDAARRIELAIRY
ncbi:MAG TPA: sugar ABC transporter substrate-binding protein [Firmicutes bacterium]|nr:MAG: sugar ABC transporter periplasmic protein [Peptococcaceae bacterium 1109]HHT72993.1 sugar ABC transporter substrate-binding protein [Bacillota bacterium]